MCNMVTDWKHAILLHGTRSDKPDDDPSSSRWCSMMAEALMGSLGRVLARAMWGEDDPLATPGRGPTLLLVLPGKAAPT